MHNSFERTSLRWFGGLRTPPNLVNKAWFANIRAFKAGREAEPTEPNWTQLNMGLDSLGDQLRPAKTHKPA